AKASKDASLDPTERRLRVRAALRWLLGELLERRGQMLLFDDWHQAEPRATELVEMLLQDGLLEPKGRGVVVLVFAFLAQDAVEERAQQVLQNLLTKVSPLVLEIERLGTEDLARCV